MKKLLRFLLIGSCKPRDSYGNPVRGEKITYRRHTPTYIEPPMPFNEWCRYIKNLKL